MMRSTAFDKKKRPEKFPVSLFAVVIGFFDDCIGFCGSNDQLVELHDGHACEEQFSVFFKILWADQAGRLFFIFGKRQFFHNEHLISLIFLQYTQKISQKNVNLRNMK